jgi:conjugal transfer/entry exclusion protein
MGGNADRLAVDLNGLEDFAHNLDTVRTTMNGTRKLFDAYEAKLGSAKVADALHSFEHNWTDGRKEIDGHLEGLTKMANDVVREIRKQDKELADELQKSAKGGGK